MVAAAAADVAVFWHGLLLGRIQPGVSLLVPCPALLGSFLVISFRPGVLHADLIRRGTARGPSRKPENTTVGLPALVLRYHLRQLLLVLEIKIKIKERKKEKERKCVV